MFFKEMNKLRSPLITPEYLMSSGWEESESGGYRRGELSLRYSGEGLWDLISLSDPSYSICFITISELEAYLR